MKLPLALCMAVVGCFGERILFIGIGTKSHKIGYTPIARALADRGHNVTVVNAYPDLLSSENVREITVKDVTNATVVTWSQLLQDGSYWSNINSNTRLLTDMMINSYDVLMESEEFQRIIKVRDVDLVVQLLLNDCALPIIDDLKVPFVYYVSQTVNSLMFDSMGMSKEYASIPSPFLVFDPEPKFRQRILNLFVSEYLAMWARSSVDQTADEYVEKDHPKARSITEIRREASLWLTHHHWTTSPARPLPPNVIPVGPLHVRPARRMSKEFQELADGAIDGFVVFTLAPIISEAFGAPRLMPIFAEAFESFSKFPLRIFWIGEKTTDVETSSNVVHLGTRVPRQDLIAHPNCRLLITHGGLMSLQEAIYHKVPILGLPFGTDQQSNLARASKEGYAIKLDWNELDENSLFDAMLLLVYNSKYRANAKRVSDLMRDELAPGADVAVYWIEHVLRHGATHLQPASKKLNFIQKNLIDVWLFVTAVLAITVASMWLMLRWLCRSLKKPSNLNSSTGDSSSTSSAPIHEESGGE